MRGPGPRRWSRSHVRDEVRVLVREALGFRAVGVHTELEPVPVRADRTRGALGEGSVGHGRRDAHTAVDAPRPLSIAAFFALRRQKFVTAVASHRSRSLNGSNPPTSTSDHRSTRG